MNSIAQQAVPNGIGHRELARAQFTSASNRVNSQFWLPDTSLVSKTRFILRNPSRKGVERQDVEGIRQGSTSPLDDSPRRLRSQSHRSAPRFQTYTYPTNKMTRNTSISISRNPIAGPPVPAPVKKIVPHGIRNTVSMSNRMNSIATR